MVMLCKVESGDVSNHEVLGSMLPFSFAFSVGSSSTKASRGPRGGCEDLHLFADLANKSIPHVIRQLDFVTGFKICMSCEC